MIEFIAFELNKDIGVLFTSISMIGFIFGFMIYLFGWLVGWFMNMISKV